MRERSTPPVRCARGATLGAGSISTFLISGAPETDARAQVPQATGLQARWRAGLHDAAVLRPAVVDEARKPVRDRDVQGCAACPLVLHEPPTGGCRVQHREEVQ